MIEIALRFDDPSPTSDHALEREIFRILSELGIPVTVGVVPYGINDGNLVPISEENCQHLVRAQKSNLIEVAQHGFFHEPLSKTPGGDNSEFYGVSIEEQARRINEGRQILETVFSGPIRGFIPPWNTYDANTVRILEEGGYAYISAGYPAPLEAKPNLRLIPRTSQIGSLHQAYAEAQRMFPLSATIISIMHHYDFTEFGLKPGKISIKRFHDDLKWLKKARNVSFATIGDLSNKLNIEQCRNMQKRHQKRSSLHWRVQRLIPLHLLLSAPLWMHSGLTFIKSYKSKMQR